MNILVNSYCNLSCSYCFAKKMLHDSSIPKDMSLEDFDYCLDFLERSKDDNVRILGGEPTVSSYFTEYCELISKRKSLSNTLIFSNGLISQESMQALQKLKENKKLCILINTNPPSFLHDKFEDLENNLKELKKSDIEFKLGVNISAQDFDYSYIIALLKKYKLNSVRWSLVCPSESDVKNYTCIEYYKSHVDIVLKFLKHCFNIAVRPDIDCNVIPLCAFDDLQLREAIIYNPSIFVRKKCVPVIDVMPNLRAIRCFNTKDIIQCNIKEFKDIRELTNYFNLYVDGKVNGKIFSKECINCSLHYNFKCGGGCIAFHLT